MTIFPHSFRSDSIRMARYPRETLSEAEKILTFIWPDVPQRGSVALVANPVGPQGRRDLSALDFELLLAAARRLGSAGARVIVVSVPDSMDDVADFHDAVGALREAGLEVVTECASHRFSVDGDTLGQVPILEVVASADAVAMVAKAGPHAHLGLAGPLWSVGQILAPNAREQLWRQVNTPQRMQAALSELVHVLRPGWVLTDLGEDLCAVVGGDDLMATEAACRLAYGLDAPLVKVEGITPEVVARQRMHASETLPMGPDRYPAVDASLCTSCGVCTSLCPTAAITLAEPGDDGLKATPSIHVEHGACLRCGICVAACPDFAISPALAAERVTLADSKALDIQDTPLPFERDSAVPIVAALALGAEAIEPPPRRPAWLDGYVAPDRYELTRLQQRNPEPKRGLVRLPQDGVTRLMIPPAWGIQDNRTSLGIAYLAGTLSAQGLESHVVDLAHELRTHDPGLSAALDEIGNPDPNGGLSTPRMPLLLQVVKPSCWGDDVPLLARQIHESAEAVAERITDPGALHGLTVADSSIAYAFALGAAIRRRGGRVVLGGPSMSHSATTKLALHAGVADAAVLGEGEAAMAALAHAQHHGSWSELAAVGSPGLVLLDGKEARWWPNARNRALDDLARPDWRGQQLPPDFIPILAARGCVTKCSFCSEQTISPKFAQRSVENVLDEMDQLFAQHGKDTFEFSDDLLNGNLQWLEAFCEALIARGAPYTWQGLCRPHRMTHELLSRMWQAGCRQISYGVQHFSARMLKIMGRREEPDPILQVLDDTLDLGMQAYVDIIVGHPGETEEDITETIRIMREMLVRYPRIHFNINPFNYIYGSGVDIGPAAYGIELEHFRETLPSPWQSLQPIAEEFLCGYRQTPEPDTVVDRVNRLAWTVFQARMPTKIPMLDEELPFCNDNCMHCGVADIMKTANVVPLNDIVDTLGTLAPRSQGRVMFGVSELTIRPDFMKILKAAKTAGMKTVAVVTNGRMFAYPMFTDKAAAAGLTHALVSIYGPTARVHQGMTRTPKSFEQTLDGLKNLLAKPEVTVMTNTVITKKNYRYLPQLTELLAGLGVANINLSFVQIIGAAAHYQKSLVPRIEDVLPYLKDAVDLGVGLGRNMGIGGLPYCVLKGYEKHFGVDDLTYIFNGHPKDNITERSPYSKAEACVRCAYHAVCLGMQEEYLAQYGQGALAPYHGRRVSRRPDCEIVRSVFPDLQYTEAGLPSSLFTDRGESEGPKPALDLVSASGGVR